RLACHRRRHGLASPRHPSRARDRPVVPVERDRDRENSRMSRKRPPSSIIRFDPSNLGADFGGYQIAVRPSRTPAEDWTIAFDARVPPDRDPAHIEANHTRFHDVMAGWVGANGGRWEHGHDWAMRAI